MTSERLLGPTHHLRRGERLLHGKDTATAVGAGRAEDWVALDSDVFYGTMDRVAGWRGTSTFLLGAHWFDSREVADWDTAPYWVEEAGAPSWGRPPTPSELALCLCHADPRVRAAALDAAGPAAPLPLLLLRCADGDEPVRDRARAAFARALDTAGDDTVRSLAALALRLGGRRHGRWGRDAVLARTGGVAEDAVRELRAGQGWEHEEARRAGIRAGAAAGVLDERELYGIALTARDPGERLEGLRAALGIRRDATAGKRFLGFLEVCEGSEVRVLALRYALDAGLLSPDDLAGLALGHQDRHVRRLAARVLSDLPGGAAVLGALSGAADGVVRGMAVAALRAGGRADALVPHLTDPSPWVRGLARRGLREASGDPHARLRALCADPAAVTPAAVSGLAEERDAGDAPRLRALLRHPDGAVRARALGGLRLLGALEDAGLPPYADDPDPRVGAVVLRALRDDPDALRGLLRHRHARVRARALVLLSHRHGLGWDEALPHFADPEPEVARAARRARAVAYTQLPAHATRSD
ncbi:HEAT repeat domain-containing protein, partial [Streptomyces sp. NPDC058955]|uniref:HEAT repeat domain-containing protein n=2 Tax=unclassified Streptomyces TaxID=2593676 RepID=UPI0036B1AA49